MAGETTRPSVTRTSGSAGAQAQPGLAHEVHVRAGVQLPQDAVDVEGLGVEVEVEPLGEHHLEDVAGQDVLAGHLTARR